MGFGVPMFILPLTTSLVFYMLAGLALTCILVLQALTGSNRLKSGYMMLAFTFVLWVWYLSRWPSGLGSWWLYALPMLWLILLFRFGFPVTRQREFPTLPDELRVTQESLLGQSARREALTFYFLLLFIGLTIGLVFFQMAMPGQ
jgi:hypothetical protein